MSIWILLDSLAIYTPLLSFRDTQNQIKHSIQKKSQSIQGDSQREFIANQNQTFATLLIKSFSSNNFVSDRTESFVSLVTLAN